MDDAGRYYKALAAYSPSHIEKPCVSVEGIATLPTDPNLALEQDEWNQKVFRKINNLIEPALVIKEIPAELSITGKVVPIKK